VFDFDMTADVFVMSVVQLCRRMICQMLKFSYTWKICCQLLRLWKRRMLLFFCWLQSSTRMVHYVT